MSVLIEQFGQPMAFSSEPWVILSDIERSIKAKIEKYGTPLKDWNISIYRGILTGCNEAFIIDETKKEELIRKDPKSAEIIRPILRGRDIQRNSYEFANLYLICTFPSKHYDIDDFPAVKDWLINGDWVLPTSPIGTGKLRLEQTGSEHIVNSHKFKSRKKTNNKWFETQDSISYWDDFNKPKIIYQELSQGSRFAFDSDGTFFVSNTAYLLTGEHLEYLLKVLNSKIIEFVFRNYYSTSMGETGLRWLNQYIVNQPIPKPTEKIIEQLQTASESDVEKILEKLYDLSDSEMQFISDSVNL
ncbi:MAG: type II restriction endonuclease [Alphaproteobacteria bacterium]|nr:type II restriction endonuclease [Alphaproteobacteria bacterium]